MGDTCLWHISVLRLPNGKEPFQDWIKKLDPTHRASIRVVIDRLADGGTKKNLKSLGDHVFEIKIDRGPGFRVYFGFIRNEIILLLLGGHKSSQSRDIAKAKEYWRKYVPK